MTTSPSARDTFGALITRDGIPAALTHDPFAWLLRHQGQSTAYALEHGGYAIHEQDAEVRGGRAYLLIREGKGAGSAHDRWIVTTLDATAALVTAGDTFPDYLAQSEILAPVLGALIFAVGMYSGGQGSPVSNIAGLLDGACRTLYRLAGATEAEVEAL